MRTFHVLCPTRFQGLLIVPVILITVFVFWNYGKSWPPSSSRLNLGKKLYYQIELKIKFIRTIHTALFYLPPGCNWFIRTSENVR